MNTRHTAEIFRPGDIIKEELEARGWTQNDLAAIGGMSAELVDAIITGECTITDAIAQILADAFGTSTQFWINLER